MSGYILYINYGFKGFWIGFFIGSLILFFSGAIFTQITLRYRKVLIDIVDICFGERVVKFAGSWDGNFPAWLVCYSA
jgi:hypothetical protein